MPGSGVTTPLSEKESLSRVLADIGRSAPAAAWAGASAGIIPHQWPHAAGERLWFHGGWGRPAGGHLDPHLMATADCRRTRVRPVRILRQGTHARAGA